MRGFPRGIIGGMAVVAVVWLGGCAQGLASGPKVGSEPTAIADGREITPANGVRTLPAILVVGSDATVIRRQWGMTRSDVDGMTRFINRYPADQNG